MKLVILLFVLAMAEINMATRLFMRGRIKDGNLGAPSETPEYILPKDEWFTQPLDHFNPTDARVWQQRYFSNAEFYKQGGPVFLMIGGEGAANPKWMVQGQWIEYAKQFGAMCYQLEHRFYGKSHPTSDLSVKNLVFLSSEQALADLAYFIESMRNSNVEINTAKWIVFGGSYPGSLAAWMRAKYPHLVNGAVSSSSPLLAQIDFKEYFVVVENALQQYSQGCIDSLVSAQDQIHIMLKHPLGQNNLVKKFNLCDPIDPGHTKRDDIANLYETLAGYFAGIVQYNKDNRNNSAMANYTIDTVCDILTNEKNGLSVDRLAEISNTILKANNEKCLEYRYADMIHKLRNVSWNSEEAEGGRQWVYQTCTEFGFFQTSTAQPKLFSETFPVNFFIQQCFDIFGPRYNEDLLKRAVDRTNTLYGGLEIVVTNVAYVHGTTDPWHALGITKTTDPQVSAFLIEGTAHCADMYPASKNDIPQLKETREEVGRLIGQWLKN